jgi:hypothetical protein
MPLARFDAPFEHHDWIFEPKLDRAVAHVEGGCGFQSCGFEIPENLATVREKMMLVLEIYLAPSGQWSGRVIQDGEEICGCAG